MDTTESEACSLEAPPAAARPRSPLTRVVGRVRSAFAGQQNEAGITSTTFQFVDSETELTALLDQSFHGTVAVFLHDPWCPVSSRAFREMEKAGVELPTIDVSRSHELSSLIERRTGVRHQSPQLIVLRDGISIWDASHWQVTAKALHAAMRTGQSDCAEGPVR